jgi:ferredoxin--NADP+ reductase
MDTVHRFAIVGSGPSGLFAAEALKQALPTCRVDIFERLPVPFGLVRFGVAPDHPKLKSTADVLAGIVALPGVRFFGNVAIGHDVQVRDLHAAYDAVVLACGAQSERSLDIPGADLGNCFGARAFVGWYNGHPDFAALTPDLSCEEAVVFGHGNVALDICRILAQPVDKLAQTDIATHALDALAGSRIRRIRLVGRRGPAQMSFTPKELRELAGLDDIAVDVKPTELVLGPASSAELAANTNPATAKNLELLRKLAERDPHTTRATIEVRFLLSPDRVHGTRHCERLELVRNRLEGEAFAQQAVPTGEYLEFGCGLLVSAIGFRATPIPGVPFDPRQAIVPNRSGHVLDLDGSVMPGLFVTGWYRRGPSGVIGTNRADATEVVATLLASLAPPRGAGEALPDRLFDPGVRHVSLADWQRLDSIERERGQRSGRPRDKLCTVPEMLAQIEGECAANDA